MHAVDQLNISLKRIVFLLFHIFRIHYDHSYEGAEEEKY